LCPHLNKETLLIRKYLLLFVFVFTATVVRAQGYTVQGEVTDAATHEPVEFATVLLKESEQWAITDKTGHFEIKNIQSGKHTIIVQCLGYVKTEKVVQVTGKTVSVTVALREDNLKLDEVEVVAQAKTDASTTSYLIDRMTLDNQQILNIGDVTTLLPGGKTVNGTLMDDSRMALRSGSSEKGNASFGTAVEVDGVRLDNNAEMSETMGSSTRNVSSSNIESIEIVTGIPSVEYGDLSNGVVKVNTRKGRSPFIVEGKISQHTRQIAVNKGFNLGRNAGVLNTSFEHARSFSDAASPHTAYQRNILSLNYMKVFMPKTTPLTLNVAFTGNIGGYNSEADPDEELDDYRKVRDNNFRGNFSLKWLLNKSWITNLSLSGAISYSDKLAEDYAHASSASTQPYIHTREEGYFVTTDYDTDPTANIILGPTGYWYVRSYTDSKPLSWSLKLKDEWTHRFGKVLNKLLLGAEYTGSRNNGRGLYYEDMRYAPTWREFRYDEQPSLNNLALYAEEKITLPFPYLSGKTDGSGAFELTAGVRDDITMISGSDYGTVSSFSPRFNARLIAWENKQNQWVSDLQLHAGWGKSVKLPSFQVLYPTPSYSDKMTFAATTTADNKSYYVYYTYPSTAVYNPDLKWQYTNQTDLGVEMKVKGTKISLSAFHHRTHRPYMGTRVYTPFTYHYTSQGALQSSGIASANRSYSVDPVTGVVTVSDLSGEKEPVALAYSNRNTYVVNTKYVNASPVDRYGLEWIVDFAQIKALYTNLRIDGNFYKYRGLDHTLFASIPKGVSSLQSDGQPYSYVGYYLGGNATSTGYSASATVSNGALTKAVNLNATLTTHIPKVRLIVSLRLESSLYYYKRSLSEGLNATRGIVLENSSDYTGTAYDGSVTDAFVAVYPEYYSTWDDPNTLIPFAEKFLWAQENDKTLYTDLQKLVVKSNYAYVMNPNHLSKYYSANFTVTKEIGEHVSVSFYANNFFNNMKKIHASQTDLYTSLFSSGYIPSYYYGLSLRLKL